MQPMTPGQVEKQKVDMKVSEMEQHASLQSDPSQLSPMDALRQALLPQRPRLKPEPKMRLISNDGQILGDAATSHKDGGKAKLKAFNPYGSKKTQGLNPHKVIMGQGSGTVQTNTKMHK